MTDAGFAWECDCGAMEYGEYPPQECPKCNALDSFAKLPEDMVKEREEELIKEVNKEINGQDDSDDEDLDVELE